MTLCVVLLLTGFALLVKGADLLVEGACDIARRWRVSEFAIGLTVVAVGTSTPELSVSIAAAVKDNAELVLGNILGSNMANLALILGGAGIFTPIWIRRESVWKEIPLCMASGLLLLAFTFTSSCGTLISRGEGLLLAAALAVYIVLAFRLGKAPPEAGAASAAPRRSGCRAASMLVAGLVLLGLGSELVVRNGAALAACLGVSGMLIGLTLVALGTSLPEIATSIAAVAKGKHDMAVGNVVGSNIVNVCIVLSLTALIRPLKTHMPVRVDAAFAAGAACLLFVFTFTGRKHRIDRWEAALFVAAYAAFLIHAWSRG